MIATLQEHFVNSWVLAQDLPEIASRAKSENLREWARKSHGKYKYPVDSQVFSYAGELLDHVGANEDTSDQRYLELLKIALEPNK